MSNREISDYSEFEASSVASRRLLRQEELILKATEVLSQQLELQRVSKVELARRLGKSKAFVTQVLSGGRNLTLRTLADFADALGCRAELSLCDDASQRNGDSEPFRWRTSRGSSVFRIVGPMGADVGNSEAAA